MQRDRQDDPVEVPDVAKISELFEQFASTSEMISKLYMKSL